MKTFSFLPGWTEWSYLSGMHRATGTAWKKTKKAKHTHTTKAAGKAASFGRKASLQRRPIVIIDRPASPGRTEKTFGIDAQRSKAIEALVEEVLG